MIVCCTERSILILRRVEEGQEQEHADRENTRKRNRVCAAILILPPLPPPHNYVLFIIQLIH